MQITVKTTGGPARRTTISVGPIPLSGRRGFERSAFGGEPEKTCWTFSTTSTHTGSRAAIFAVMHNTAPRRRCDRLRSSALRGTHATAAVHHPCRRRGGVAAGGVGAEGDGTGTSDRMARHRMARLGSRTAPGVPQGSERRRLCRGQERRDRVSLGGGSIRKNACTGGRSGSPASGGDLRLRRTPPRPRGHVGDINDPDRFFGRQ